MIFQPTVCKTANLNLTLNGIILPKTDCTKFLGTWIDDKLFWTDHIKKLKTELMKRLGLLKRIKRFLSTHAMKSNISSNISYTISMWGPMASCCLINQIQAVQDKAVLCIKLGLKPTQAYHKHKILTVDCMIELEMCKLGYRMTNNMLPKPLYCALQMDQHEKSTVKLHRYETRNKPIPFYQRCHTTDTGIVICLRQSQFTASCQ